MTIAATPTTAHAPTRDTAWHRSGRLERPRELTGVVVENRPVARDAGVLRFRVTSPGPMPAFAPGQYLQLRAWTGVDPLLGRPFSILDQGDGPEGPWLSVLYQVFGRGTALMAGARAGDPVHAVGPLGRPFQAPGRPGPALVVAGGVGIPPFLMVVRELVAEGREAVVLLGARDRAHLYLEDELREAGAAVRVATEDGSRGVKGRVTVLLEEELGARGAANVGAVYTCGPEGMLHAVVGVARRHGAPGQASLEKLMACGIGVCFTCVCRLRAKDGRVKNQRICLAGPVVSFADLPDDEGW
jgi:dihydroorotate dehydrogenase electron transfer subunit